MNHNYYCSIKCNTLICLEIKNLCFKVFMSFNVIFKICFFFTILHSRYSRNSLIFFIFFNPQNSSSVCDVQTYLTKSNVSFCYVGSWKTQNDHFRREHTTKISLLYVNNMYLLISLCVHK